MALKLFLKNLPEDVVFRGIQEFIGKEKQIYYNKYVKEYRFKLNVNDVSYKKISGLFENMSIIYNKNSGGSILEIGQLKLPIMDKFLGKQEKFSITHIIYKVNNTLFINTELCIRKEYYDPYGYDDDGRLDWDDVPDKISFDTFYTNSVKI
jgi:hypothetical protein